MKCHSHTVSEFNTGAVLSVTRSRASALSAQGSWWDIASVRKKGTGYVVRSKSLIT